MLALLAAPASHARNRTFFVTDAGIGRLNAETMYAAKDVSAALGGMPVAERAISHENIPIPVLEATRDDRLPPADVLARCPVEAIIWISERVDAGGLTLIGPRASCALMIMSAQDARGPHETTMT